MPVASINDAEPYLTLAQSSNSLGISTRPRATPATVGGHALGPLNSSLLHTAVGSLVVLALGRQLISTGHHRALDGVAPPGGNVLIEDRVDLLQGFLWHASTLESFVRSVRERGSLG